MTTPAPRRLGPLARLLDLLVAAYQLIPRFGPPRCKFFPSCSAYARDALRAHGALRGSWLAARRLGRCHPWTIGGMDPVPANTRRKSA